MAHLWLLAVLPLVAHAFNGIPADNQMVEMPGMVRYPITVVDGAPTKDRVFRRQTDVSLFPQKSGFFYSIEVKLGTPLQPVSVNFDTGSDELWVNPSCTKSADPTFCHKFGRFNGSQTFVDVKRNSTINYGTGFANLEFGYDYVQIGSSRISQQLIGVATDSEFAVTGILGAGPNLDGWNSHYPTVIDNLATQGFTKSRAFSLDIRSLESKRGSVVFGGLDTKKFSGPLEKRPIIPADKSPDGMTRYWIYLDGISISQPNGSLVNVFDKPNGQAVLLDSGYTVSALPSAIFDKIVAAFPEAKPPAAGDNLYKIPCSIGNSKGRLDFKFGKTVITVSYNDFIWHQSTNGVCVLGITRDDDFPVLGDTFLRAAYVVYDWDNRNLHVANNEDCGSHLVPIGKGPDSVPFVVGECGAQSATTPSYSRPTSAPLSNSTYNNGTGRVNTTAWSRPAVVAYQPIASPVSSGWNEAPGLPTYSSNLPGDSSDPSTDPSDLPTYSGVPSDSSDPDLSASSSALPINSSGPSINTPDIAIDSSGSPTDSEVPAYHTDLPTYTSTFTSTRISAVTSCPPSATNCAVDSVVTETVTGTTTWCPSRNATAALSTTRITSVVVTTRTYTVSDCHGGDCRNGHATTEALAAMQPSWSDITATWTIPRTHTCTKGEYGCVPGQKVTTTHIVTVKPMTTGPSPTPVPGCTDCRMPPPVTITSIVASPVQPPSQEVHYPIQNPPPQASPPAPSPPVETYPAQLHQAVNTVPGTINVVTRPTASGCINCGLGGSSSPMVTAGAVAWRAPLAAVIIGALLAAAM